VQHKKCFRVDCAKDDPRFKATTDLIEGEDPSMSMLVAPLIDGDCEVCGVLRCSVPYYEGGSILKRAEGEEEGTNSREGANSGEGDDPESSQEEFWPAHEDALTRTLPIFSMTLRNTLAAVAHRRDRLMAKAMLSFSQMLVPGKRSEIKSLVDMWAERVRELVCADRCTLFLYEDDQRRLVSYFSDVGGTIGTIELMIDEDGGIAGTCARTRETLNIPDAYNDKRFNSSFDASTGYLTRTILAMPFSSPTTGKLIGVCQVINKFPVGVPFDEGDESLLSSVLQMAGLVIENHRLTGEYETLKGAEKAQRRKGSM